MLLFWSLRDREGHWIGLRNFATYLGTPGLRISLVNTCKVAAASTLISVTAAFTYAYALTHARLPFRRVWRHIALLPLYAPSMLYGIGLVYLFGNQGLVTHGFFGRLPFAIDIRVYGLTGIIMAESVFAFPAAFLVLIVSLSHVDRRLYEAARSLGASGARTFFSVTLPGCRLGLVSAASIAFILSFTDFGAPKIVGRKATVLAVDIFQRVLEQHDFSMGATISILLLTPTLLAFALDRLARRRADGVSGRALPYHPPKRAARDIPLSIACLLIAGALLAVVAAPLLVSVVSRWPYSLSDRSVAPGPVFTLDHYDFAQFGGTGGYGAFFNSLAVSALTAIAGTAVTFIGAYAVERFRVARGLRRSLYGLFLVPLALPGLVLGLAYLVLINKPDFAGLPNPLAWLYASTAILVICNIVHFSGVSFLTARAAVKQLDPEFEPVAGSMGVSTARLFFRVTVPFSMPALLEVAIYYFVSAMTTVSAVIFLCAPATQLASVAVVNLDDAGRKQEAAAMSVLILLTNVTVRLLMDFVAGPVLRRTQRWRSG
jgi:iron(III) transport system permease protein